MKIYFIGQKGIPTRGGGVERHVDELATRLAKLGQEIFVYCRERYTQNTPETYNRVKLIYTPAIYTKNLEAITHTITSLFDLRKREVDIIHFQAIGPSLMIPLARLIKPKAKIVATIHCADYFHQKWGFIARFALRLGERIAATFAHETITVSQGLQVQVAKAYKKQATYIPNGVQIPELGSDPKLLDEWNIKPQEYIVAISRLIRHKGLHFLIDAYKEIETDKKLVIVGSSSYTDNYEKELHAMARGNENIIFTGNQTGDKLKALFEHGYLFVQPSLKEGLSIALLEALSYNQAVLASDIPENMEVVGDKAITFKAGSVEDLAHNLEFMLSHPQITKGYKQGREYVNKEYNWEKIAQKTIEVYQKAMA